MMVLDEVIAEGILPEKRVPQKKYITSIFLVNKNIRQCISIRKYLEQDKAESLGDRLIYNPFEIEYS